MDDEVVGGDVATGELLRLCPLLLRDDDPDLSLSDDFLYFFFCGREPLVLSLRLCFLPPLLPLVLLPPIEITDAEEIDS